MQEWGTGAACAHWCLSVCLCVCLCVPVRACLYRKVSKRVRILRADIVQEWANPVSPDTEIVARIHCHCCREICQHTPRLSLLLTESLHSCFIHAPSGKEKHKITCLCVQMCVYSGAYVHIVSVCVHPYEPYWKKKRKERKSVCASPEEGILLLKIYWIINGQTRWRRKKKMYSGKGLPFGNQLITSIQHMPLVHFHIASHEIAFVWVLV